MGCSKSSSKREVYTDTGLPQDIRKISNKQPNPPSKGIRRIRTNKTQSQQKNRNNKDQSRYKQNRDPPPKKTHNRKDQ